MTYRWPNTAYGANRFGIVARPTELSLIAMRIRMTLKGNGYWSHLPEDQPAVTVPLILRGIRH